MEYTKVLVSFCFVCLVADTHCAVNRVLIQALFSANVCPVADKKIVKVTVLFHKFLHCALNIYYIMKTKKFRKKQRHDKCRFYF